MASGCLLTLGFVALNALAFRHAWVMTHFADEGTLTPAPEKLSLMRKAWVLLAGVNVPRPQYRTTPADYGMAFQTSQFAGANGTSIEAWSVKQESSNGVVILFHGYGVAKDTLLEAGREFYSMGYDLLLVDFYGSGGSSGNSTSIGYFEAEDVVAAFQFASRESAGRRVILYGQSMGSAAILRAVAAFDVQPDALIIECPFDSLLVTVGRRFNAMGLPATPLAHLLVFWGGMQHGFAGLDHHPAEYASHVSCPTLLMSGDSDPRVTVEDVERIHWRLAGRKQFKLFQGAGHESYLALRRDEWVEHVRAFLSGANP